MLIDKDATVRKVTQAITTAAATQLVAGDTFFLTYSGHGGQVPDRNGDEAQADSGELGEFPDQYDETWVLYDRQLVDDELFYLWSLFAPKVGIVMFSDSCHSGTVARRMPWDVPVDAPASRRMPPRRRGGDVRRPQAAVRHHPEEGADPAARSSIQAAVVLISGCQDNQTSADGRVNGRFTGPAARRVERRRLPGQRPASSGRRSSPACRPTSRPTTTSSGRANKSLTTRQVLKI